MINGTRQLDWTGPGTGLGLGLGRCDVTVWMTTTTTQGDGQTDRTKPDTDGRIANRWREDEQKKGISAERCAEGGAGNGGNGVEHRAITTSALRCSAV